MSKKVVSILLIALLMIVLCANQSFAVDGKLNLIDDENNEELNGPNLNGSLEQPSTDQNQKPNTDEKLPQTGIEDTSALLVVGIAITFVGIYAYRKMNYYADI